MTDQPAPTAPAGLRAFARHLWDCHWRDYDPERGGPGECDCGLDAALASPSEEPGLDVERLAEALDADWGPAWLAIPVIGGEEGEVEGGWDKHALAAIVADEYARLAKEPE